MRTFTYSKFTCTNCNEEMIGDGYTTVYHCPNVDVIGEGYEPDADAVYCSNTCEEDLQHDI